MATMGAPQPNRAILWIVTIDRPNQNGREIHLPVAAGFAILRDPQFGEPAVKDRAGRVVRSSCRQVEKTVCPHVP